VDQEYLASVPLSIVSNWQDGMIVSRVGALVACIACPLSVISLALGRLDLAFAELALTLVAAPSLLRTLRLRRVGSSIRIGNGHMWIGGDGQSNVGVMLRNGHWSWLEKPGRLEILHDDFLNEDSLKFRFGDEESILGIPCHQGRTERRLWLAIANTCLAEMHLMRDDVLQEDPFSSARVREDLAEGLLERKWDHTEPGILSTSIRYPFRRRPTTTVIDGEE